jgi:1-acyl-sn-glycerol-3-phosphate acyltransferase
MKKISFIRSIRGVLRLVAAMMQIASGIFLIYRLKPNAPLADHLSVRQRWSTNMLNALGVQLSIETPEFDFKNTTGLIVSNHVSFLDIFVINAVSPSIFVSKDDVKTWPLVGWLATKAETIFIERGSRRAAHRTQETMVSFLNEQRRIAIFPEGTTSNGDSISPFHAALFQSAVEADAPVRCLHLAYKTADGFATYAPAYIGEISLPRCLWQIVTSEPFSAHVSFLTTIAPPHPDRRHLAHRAHQVIGKACKTSLIPSLPEPFV